MKIKNFLVIDFMYVQYLYSTFGYTKLKNIDLYERIVVGWVVVANRCSQ